MSSQNTYSQIYKKFLKLASERNSISYDRYHKGYDNSMYGRIVEDCFSDDIEKANKLTDTCLALCGDYNYKIDYDYVRQLPDYAIEYLITFLPEKEEEKPKNNNFLVDIKLYTSMRSLVSCRDKLAKLLDYPFTMLIGGHFTLDLIDDDIKDTRYYDTGYAPDNAIKCFIDYKDGEQIVITKIEHRYYKVNLIKHKSCYWFRLV